MGRWNYTKTRRIYMQIALCGVLCGSVALAALITKKRRANSVTTLAAVRDFGGTQGSLPRGWRLVKQGQGPILFVAREPGADPRVLTGRKDQVDPATPPLDYLQTTDLFDESIGPESDSGEHITMAGGQGILLAIKRPVAHGYQTRWIACCVRPSGVAITLVMDCPENDDPDEDRHTMEEIAASLEVHD